MLIAAERGVFDLPGFLTSLGDTPVALSAVTASELLHGVHRAKSASARAQRSQYVESVLANIPVLPFGLREACIHAGIWSTLASKGQLIGAHDMLIAATALAINSKVATCNRDEFRCVPKLSIASTEKFLRDSSS
ncbi:MAG: PIN domain-containing protein [Gemmatimonas sp.]